VYQALRWAIEPSWTRGHRFCVAHEVTGERGETCYVAATEGRRLSVSLTPAEEVTATVRTPDEDFLAFVSGLPARTEVTGDEAHVAQLRAWIAQARREVVPGG
jgi:hypothetical protein